MGDARRQRSRAVFAAGDPLRAVAALSVAVSHVVGMALLTWHLDGGGAAEARAAFGPAGDAVVALATGGVSIFFVLSGYLLSRPFLRAALLDERRPPLRRFVRNRILRVVPAYWFLLTALVLAVLVGGGEGASAERVLRTYLFAAEEGRALPLWTGHTWTLDVEMRFYAALALAGTLVALLGRGSLSRGWRTALIAAGVLAFTSWSFAAHPPDVSILALGFAENVGRFSPGIALALLEIAAPRVGGGRWIPTMAGVLFCAGFVGLVAVGVAGQDPRLPLGAATPWLLALASGAVVGAPLLRQWRGRPTWRALDNRPLRWAGSRSYSIYLVHLPVYAALMTAASEAGYARRVVLLATTGLPLALVAAEGLHRWVERPFLRRRGPSQAAPGRRRRGAPAPEPV